MTDDSGEQQDVFALLLKKVDGVKDAVASVDRRLDEHGINLKYVREAVDDGGTAVEKLEKRIRGLEDWKSQQIGANTMGAQVWKYLTPAVIAAGVAAATAFLTP